jgi:hypothetical protein
MMECYRDDGDQNSIPAFNRGGSLLIFESFITQSSAQEDQGLQKAEGSDERPYVAAKPKNGGIYG